VTAGEVVATKGGHKMLRKNTDYTRAADSPPPEETANRRA